MADREMREAFVTLATNDTYSLGCLVLEKSLRKVGTTRQLVVMVTSGVSESMRNQLARVFDLIQEVNLLDSKDPINLELLGRPDLNVTFTKLHCWRLTQFDKAVFLDADTLVIQNVDELFDREELSAAPDAGWPDCFNSGVFVFKPSQETYQSLLSFAITKGSFDGGDQGLLNLYFRDWSTKDIAKHLPFVFNVVSQAFYSYLPAFKQFRQNVKIVHFIGATKPWHHTYNTTTGKVTPLPGSGHDTEFLQMWWNIFMEFVQPFLDSSLSSSRAPSVGCGVFRSSRELTASLVVSQPLRRDWITSYNVPWSWSQSLWNISLSGCCNLVLRAFCHCWRSKPPNTSCKTPFISADSKTKDNPTALDKPPLHSLPRGEIYIKVVYPYVPPSIDVVYYSPPKPSTTLPTTLPVDVKDLEHKSEDKSDLNVVKMPVITRAYSSMESTYMEEPLSYVDPEKPLCIVYEAPVMTTKWEEVNKADENVKKEVESSTVSCPELHSSPVKNDGLKGSVSEKVKNVEKETTGIAPSVNPLASSEGGSSKPLPTGDFKSHNGHVGGYASSEGGLVGELASLKITSTGVPGVKIELSDRERRLNWEKGQIDYLDRDSFSNIQRKLDESLSSTTSTPAQSITSAPFSSGGVKSSTETAVTSPPAKPASTSSGGDRSSTETAVTSPPAKPVSTSSGGDRSSTETAVTSPPAKPASTKPPLISGSGRGIAITATSRVKPVSSEKKS